MAKLREPQHVVVDTERRVVISGSRQPRRTLIIFESRKPWSLNVLLQNGSEISIDKRGNSMMKTPNVSEVF